jgi:biotin transport system substrate-specific component
MSEPVAITSKSTSAGWITSWPIAVGVVCVGSVLLALSSKVSVPFWPVPMTMQPLVVLLIGMIGGARIGFATVALYLIEGGFGLPVFSGTPEKGIGLVYMAGPTGGYLAGFLLSALVTGVLADRGWTRSILSSLVVACVGLVCIYALGLVWLSQLVGVSKAFAVGAVPFLFGDIIKVIIAALAVPMATSALSRT